jgi:hypothetical protein
MLPLGGHFYIAADRGEKIMVLFAFTLFLPQPPKAG